MKQRYTKIRGNRDAVYFDSEKRIMQIANWIRDDNPSYIREIELIIKFEGIEKAFEFFYNSILENDRLEDTIQYLLYHNMEKFGKRNILGKLFTMLFSRKLKQSILTRTIKKRDIIKKTEKDIRKYNKIVKRKNREIGIAPVRIGNRFQLVGRDIKTGQFVKVPVKELLEIDK